MKPLPSQAELKPRGHGIGRRCPGVWVVHDGITSVDKGDGVVWSVVDGDGSRNGLEWAWDGFCDSGKFDEVHREIYVAQA